MACCLMAPSIRHQAITWTNVDLSLVKSSDIRLMATSLEIPQPSITKCSLKITYLKSQSNLQGANELNVSSQIYLHPKDHGILWLHVETTCIPPSECCECDNSKSPWHIVFKFGVLNWLTFQGHGSEVKVSASQKAIFLFYFGSNFTEGSNW